MSTALLISLLIHALLLSLSFGGPGLGLPGLGLPWRERRFEADDLRVALAPAQVTAAVPALIEPPADLKPTATINLQRWPAADEVAVMARSPGGGPGARASPPIAAPDLIGSERSDAVTLVAPVAPLVPTPVISDAPGNSSPQIVMSAPQNTGDQTQKQIEPVVRQRAFEPAKLDRPTQVAQRPAEQMEAAPQEATRQEAERQDAERLETARQAAVRQEVERLEAARLESEHQEAARQEAARKEAARQDAERLEAARQAAVRQGVERLEAARLESERQEATRQEIARQERALQEAARQEQAARREAALRSIGRQLDEEAAKREAASLAARPSSALPSASSSARRGRLFGRTDPNTELLLYAEALSRKIQLNMTFEMIREVAKQPHTNPLVTMALRSDGSVESVTFVISSGVPGIDEAIRRIVHSQVPYPPFPPGLAREFDVVEIRRSWYFDMAIRLY